MFSSRPGPFLRQRHIQFHIQGSLHRVWAVGSDLFETQVAIHGDGILHHRFDGVEANALVADLTGLGDDALRQRAPQPLAAKLWTQKKPLHFANARVQLMQRNAACELTVTLYEQQAALWWSVVAGESGKFLVEVLKAEAEAQGLRVLEKQF